MPDNIELEPKSIVPYGTYQFAKIQHFMLLIESEDTNYIWTLDNDGYVTLIMYLGTNTKIKVPKKIEGHPVKYIECTCFNYNTTITSVTIPEGIVYIG